MALNRITGFPSSADVSTMPSAGAAGHGASNAPETLVEPGPTRPETLQSPAMSRLSAALIECTDFVPAICQTSLSEPIQCPAGASPQSAQTAPAHVKNARRQVTDARAVDWLITKSRGVWSDNLSPAASRAARPA